MAHEVAALRLPGSVRDDLVAAGYNTADDVRAASEEELAKGESARACARWSRRAPVD